MSDSNLRSTINLSFPYLMLLPAIIEAIYIYQHGFVDPYNFVRLPIALLLFVGGLYIVVARIRDRLSGKSYQITMPIRSQIKVGHPLPKSER